MQIDILKFIQYQELHLLCAATALSILFGILFIWSLLLIFLNHILLKSILPMMLYALHQGHHKSLRPVHGGTRKIRGVSSVIPNAPCV